MIVTKGRGYVYTIQYHIVWCVKYRHRILTSEVNLWKEHINFEYTQLKVKNCLLQKHLAVQDLFTTIILLRKLTYIKIRKNL